MTIFLGVLLGLGAATAQSLSYLFSRRFTSAQGGGRRRLLVLSLVMQGALCAPAVWLVWPAQLPPVSQWWRPVVGEGVFFMMAQVCLFTALRDTEASRVAPLLGLKIVIVALLTVVALGDAIAPLQWTGVVLAVVGAFVLNYTGGALPWRAVAAVLGACVGYSLSDFSIRLVIESMAPVPPVRAAVFGMTLVYVGLGVLMLPLLVRFGAREMTPWRDALPYAVAWLAGMALLHGCFALAGIVLGGIVQSTRGLISIGLGAVLAWYGLVHLEQRVTRGVFWRRLTAAALMSTAVALYVIGG